VVADVGGLEVALVGDRVLGVGFYPRFDALGPLPI
jgi:hypothetical protein